MSIFPILRTASNTQTLTMGKGVYVSIEMLLLQDPLCYPLYKLLLLDNGFVLLSNNFTSTETFIRKKNENPFNDEGTCNKDNGDTCSTQKPAPTFKESPDFENELVPLSLRDWWFVFFSSFL